MAKLFNANDCVDGWLQVSNYLIANHMQASNVLVTIANPTFEDPAWLTRFNPKGVHPNGDKIRDVVNTIFPRKTLQNSADREDFYARYLKAHNRAKSGRWGTYFERLVSFGATEENQLESVIRGLKWKNKPRAALTVHLSSPETDSLQPIGAPCWHFGEFMCVDKTDLDLVVVYRNHDYFNKALGNFLGLSRLLSFVCAESGMTPGKLICHSVHAYSTTKSNLEKLVAM